MHEKNREYESTQEKLSSDQVSKTHHISHVDYEVF